MLEFLKKLFSDKTQDVFKFGTIMPTQEQLDAAIHFEDIVPTASVSPVIWAPLDITKLPKWPQYDQGQTSECVAHTDSLMDTILYFIRTGLEVLFAPEFKYWHRSNKNVGDGKGMVGTDIGHISRSVGAVPFLLFPTSKTETEANKHVPEKWLYEIAKVFQTDDIDIIVPVKNMETIVSIQQVTGKPLMVWFQFDIPEWTTEPVVLSQKPKEAHSVTFIPKRGADTMTFGIYKGEKAIIIQDSWGLKYGIDGKRIIKESFFKQRNFFVRYKMRFKFDIKDVGEKWDGSMISLQKCLRSMGYFPNNVEYFENFGKVTQASLMLWKKDNGLSPDSVLDEQTKALLRMKF